MTWKEFFKPTKWKIILALISAFFAYFLLYVMYFGFYCHPDAIINPNTSAYPHEQLICRFYSILGLGYFSENLMLELRYVLGLENSIGLQIISYISFFVHILYYYLIICIINYFYNKFKKLKK